MFKKIANFFKKIFNFFKKVNQKVKDFLFKNRYGTIMFLVGIIVAFWDLTLKFLLDGKNFPAIKGFFNIYSTHNTGGAWSIFAGSTILLAIISIAFIALIVFFNYRLKTKNYFYAISMGLLLSGALCNLYDRLVLGYVRDFINLEFIKFPIFNIADIAITVGVILLCVYFLFIMPKLERQKEKEIDVILEGEQQDVSLDKKSTGEKTQENESMLVENSQDTLEEKNKAEEALVEEISQNTKAVKKKNNSKRAKNARK